MTRSYNNSIFSPIKTILTILAAINAITFILYGWDKRCARFNKLRIPEKTLLTLVLIGGSIGAILGAYTFRHKTRKLSYLLKFILIIILQLAIACLVYYLKTRQ